MLSMIKTYLSRLMRWHYRQSYRAPIDWCVAEKSGHAVGGAKAILSLETSQPLSRVFGFDRGTPLDRYYIEKFLFENKSDFIGIGGEIAEKKYLDKFGSNLSQKKVIHFLAQDSADLCANLEEPESWPENYFDILVLTQTLPFLFDLQSAVKSIYRTLKPGGIALLTASGISPISVYDMERWGDYWRFTDKSLQKIFLSHFGSENIQIKQYGNSFIATCFVQGFSVEDIPSEYLDNQDLAYPIIYGVRVKK